MVSAVLADVHIDLLWEKNIISWLKSSTDSSWQVIYLWLCANGYYAAVVEAQSTQQPQAEHLYK